MYDIMFSDEHHGSMMETDRRCCRIYQNRKKYTMIASNVRVRFIELSMPSIEAFRRNIVASALQARDMTMGPHHYFADDLRVAIEAIGNMIQAVKIPVTIIGLELSVVALGMKHFIMMALMKTTIIIMTIITLILCQYIKCLL